VVDWVGDDGIWWTALFGAEEDGGAAFLGVRRWAEDQTVNVYIESMVMALWAPAGVRMEGLRQQKRDW